MTMEADKSIMPAAVPSDAARLIVCERSGRWAVALRRELAGSGVRVYETRTVGECWETLARTPAGFVIAELTGPGASELLRRMAHLERDFPLARVAIVAERALHGCEWLMREAGAVHFTCSPRQLGPMARLACRHLRRVPATQRTITEQIWASLPWGEHIVAISLREM